MKRSFDFSLICAWTKGWVNGWGRLRRGDSHIFVVAFVKQSRSFVQHGISTKTHLKLISREVSFAYTLFCSCPTALQFCLEHGKIEKRLDSQNYDMVERDFARFEFSISLRQISYIAQLNESHEFAFYKTCCRYSAVKFLQIDSP